jgi:hypothetical protein
VLPFSKQHVSRLQFSTLLLFTVEKVELDGFKRVPRKERAERIAYLNSDSVHGIRSLTIEIPSRNVVAERIVPILLAAPRTPH